MENTISLPQPSFLSDKTFAYALRNRKTLRDFSPKSLSLDTLSELLWAAWGVNRADGRRTAPSPRNTQSIDLYVFISDGIYKYNAERHELDIIKEGDFRKDTGMQPFVASAPLNIVMVSNPIIVDGQPIPKEKESAYSHITAGGISENIYLYCAANGLPTVARAMFDKDVLEKLLGLKNGQEAIYTQTIGYSA